MISEAELDDARQRVIAKRTARRDGLFERSEVCICAGYVFVAGQTVRVNEEMRDTIVAIAQELWNSTPSVYVLHAEGQIGAISINMAAGFLNNHPRMRPAMQGWEVIYTPPLELPILHTLSESDVYEHPDGIIVRSHDGAQLMVFDSMKHLLAKMGEGFLETPASLEQIASQLGKSPAELQLDM